MKTRYKIMMIAAAFAMLLVWMTAGAQAGSFYASHAYLAAANVGPATGARSLEFLSAYTTTEGAYVEIMAGTPTVYKVDTAQSTAVTNVTMSTTNGLTVADTVLIVHATGTVDYRVIAGLGASGLVTFTEAPSSALTTGGRMWRLAAAGRFYLPFIYSGTNTLTKVTQPLQISGQLYTGYGVPFRVQLSGTNCVLTGTTGD